MRISMRLGLAIGALVTAFSLSGCTFLDKLAARDHLNKGVKAYTIKNYDEAAAEFEEAVRLDPELIDAYLYLATTYRQEFIPFVTTVENLERGRRAIVTFEQVLEREPNNINAIMNIADLYRNLDQPEDAKDWYRRLMGAEENPALALYGIAVIDYNLSEDRTGRDGENVENLSEEQIAELHTLLDEAIESLKQALEAKPDYTDAMEYLNLLYREKSELAEDREEKRKWDREALLLAEQALELKRKQQLEEERRRREFLKSGESR